MKNAPIDLDVELAKPRAVYWSIVGWHSSLAYVEHQLRQVREGASIEPDLTEKIDHARLHLEQVRIAVRRTMQALEVAGVLRKQEPEE